jgi:hypothetical protein
VIHPVDYQLQARTWAACATAAAYSALPWLGLLLLVGAMYALEMPIVSAPTSATVAHSANATTESSPRRGPEARDQKQLTIMVRDRATGSATPWQCDSRSNVSLPEDLEVDVIALPELAAVFCEPG